MSEMSTFGARLRDLRVKSGLSQEEAAARLGVSPQSVSKWETDKCYPEFLLIMPLAQLYGVSADMLLGSEDRRAYWEAQWQEALRQGGEAATLPVTEAALKELPGDRQFRYRQGCEEYILALSAKDPEEKRRLLSSAEKHLAALHADCPEYDVATGMLVEVLVALDRRQEAAELIRDSKGDERLWLLVLQGQELRDMKRRLLTRDFRRLLMDLTQCGDSAGITAAERIVKEVLDAEGFFADMLMSASYERLVLSLEAGDPEAAMARLRESRDLTARWAGAGGYDKAPERAPFLEPHVPLTHEEHLWEDLFSILQNPLLDPLRSREDFQALLAEAEAHQPV